MAAIDEWPRQVLASSRLPTPAPNPCKGALKINRPSALKQLIYFV